MQTDYQYTPVSPSPNARTLCDRSFRESSQSDIKIIRQLDVGKFSIYLAKSESNDKNYAMKIFPYQDGHVCNLFHNEKQFVNYKHPHVVDIVEAKEDYYTCISGIRTRAAYTLMEYAPYKDFYFLMLEKQITLDEKLARTYFHQLIEGLEFLHSQGVYHLDIKLDNLLLGDNFMLKIADFDISYIKGQGTITSRGTKCYRAPELARGRCVDPASADIFSAGIVLFNLKTGGFIPYNEEKSSRGVDLYPLLKEQSPKFWDFHGIYQKKSADFFDEDFKELFISMTKTDSTQRATISDIKNSKWYNGPIYTKEEITTVMSSKYNSQA
jgi:serine/threonine protein kinase